METLIDYLSRVAGYDWWVVAIELFLIGLVIYWAVDFLEGTRGERLFRGVVFILIAGFLILKLIVDQLAFDRLQYLYNGFLIAVLIIAVAAFQPEIRRALIRIGQPRFWSSSPQHSKTIEEIVTAVIKLSAAKTGAIIVIERRVALGEFIETGVRIDATVKAELLKTIFHPGSALHDMAAIIRGERIIAARVQLPLAEAAADFELGSRHRAAIGITTGSDAVCLVVSEETGIISFAQGGKLTRNISQSRLRKLLVNAMSELVPIVDWLYKISRKTSGSQKQKAE
ncbi:MAG: diadenylate cyclase CdaA [Planctomycetota bacterium]|jgi:diadenylate cyclase